MKLDKKGLDLIKSFEGCRLKTYKCVPTEKYYTIGYGQYGKDVSKDMVITSKQAEELLSYPIEFHITQSRSKINDMFQYRTTNQINSIK